MKNLAKKIYMIESKFAELERNVTAIIFILMCISIMFQIICRFILKLSVPWTEELIRYSFIAVSFVGMGAVQMSNDHIRVDLLQTRIAKIKDPIKRKKANITLEVVRNIVILIIAVYVGLLCLDQLLTVFKMGQLTPALKVPMWFLNAFIFYGFLTLALHTLCRIFCVIFGKEEEGGNETCI